MEPVLRQSNILRMPFSAEQSSLNKLAMMILGTILISGLSQCAPAQRERWDPYHYPTVRSITSVAALLSRRSRIPQQVKSSPMSTKKLIITTTPTKVAQARSNINRRAAQSPSANLRTSQLNMKANNNSQKFLGIDVANFDLGNATAINLALTEFIKSAEHVIREVLTYTQNDLLRVIGQIDQGADMFQKRIQNSGLRLAFAGQKAVARSYEALPSFINKLLQRLVTPSDGRSREQIMVQLNEAIKNLRMLKKMLVQAMDEHEKDFHNVFQERFTQINQYLRVPELPRRPLAWFS